MSAGVFTRLSESVWQAKERDILWDAVKSASSLKTLYWKFEIAVLEIFGGLLFDFYFNFLVI